jgi:ATP-binding cassette, subfamily C, bacterial
MTAQHRNWRPSRPLPIVGSMTVVARPWAAGRAFLGDFLGYAGLAAAKAAGLVLLGAALEGIGLLILVPLLAAVFEQAPTQSGPPGVIDRLLTMAGGVSTFERLAAILVLFCLLMIARSLVLWRRDLTLAKLQIGFVEHQRLRVAERLAAASWEQVARLRHARVVHVMASDIQRVGAAAHFLLTGIVSVAMLAAHTAIAFLLSPSLAAVAVVLLALAGWSLLATLHRTYGLGEQMTNANLTLLESMSRFLGGLKLAAGQNLQDRFVGEFRNTLDDLARRQLDNTRHQVRARLALTTLAALLAALLVLLGFGLLHVAPAVLSALVIIFARMNAPAVQLQQAAQQFAHAVPAHAGIAALLAELPPGPIIAPAAGEPSSDGPPSDGPPSDGPIMFDKVSFVHSGAPGGDETVGIADLSLTIAPGEFVALTGPSGAGKTTFADLLVGLIRPRSGTVSVGGQTIEGTILSAWRANLAYVAQDPYLFHDTVRRNLAWSSPDASEEDMRAALRLVGADVLVDRFPDGLDTVVGERGTLVSGGERQRLSLARALLRRPRLLVLDEATNALDVDAERKILEALRTLTPRPTLVLIAHRSDSFAACDRVLRLENGRLHPC